MLILLAIVCIVLLSAAGISTFSWVIEHPWKALGVVVVIAAVSGVIRVNTVADRASVDPNEPLWVDAGVVPVDAPDDRCSLPQDGSCPVVVSVHGLRRTDSATAPIIAGTVEVRNATADRGFVVDDISLLEMRDDRIVGTSDVWGTCSHATGTVDLADSKGMPLRPGASITCEVSAGPVDERISMVMASADSSFIRTARHWWRTIDERGSLSVSVESSFP